MPSFFLDLSLNVVDGVGCLDVERDRLAGERYHKDLHAVARTRPRYQTGKLGARCGSFEGDVVPTLAVVDLRDFLLCGSIGDTVKDGLDNIFTDGVVLI